MKESLKRLISLILAFTLVCGMIPSQALVVHATESEEHNHDDQDQNTGSDCVTTGEHRYTIVVEGSEKPATCVADGSVTMKCATCDATEDQTLPVNPENHSDAAGDGNHSCDVCGAEAVSGHTGGTATCMAAAVCADCGATYGEPDRANHTGVTTLVGAVEATAEANGYTGDTVCECGDVIAYGATIPAIVANPDQGAPIADDQSEERKVYRWEMNAAGDALVNITADGQSANELTVSEKAEGLAVSGGNITNYKASLASPITLDPGKEWSIEWKSNEWKGMMLSSTGTLDSGSEYLWRNYDKGVMALGVREGKSTSANYGGISLAADTNSRTWRVENRLENGSNMVYLLIDGNEVGAMNNHYNGSTDQEATSEWVQNNAFEFKYIGANANSSTQYLNATGFEYLEICTDKEAVVDPGEHEHQYKVTAEKAASCKEAGHKTYTCECGASYEDPIAQLPHSYSDGWIAKDGEMYRYCDVCDEPQTGMVAYRWEYDAEKDNTAYMTSVTENGNTENVLTPSDVIDGPDENGKFTTYKAKMASPVTLKHDEPWIIEWKSTGNWKGMLLALQGDYREGDSSIYRNNEKGLVAIGYRVKNANGKLENQNYGIIVTPGTFDMTKSLIWRLENRIEADGSNMVHLWIENEYCGALNTYYVGSNPSEAKDGNGLSGKDFTFGYFGAGKENSTQYLAEIHLEYLQIWTNGEPHKHDYNETPVAGTCITPAKTIYTCQNEHCGYTYTKDGAVDSNNHTNNTTVNGKKDATCVADGYTGDTVCECGVTIKQGEAIPATGVHTDKDGDKNHTCDTCPAENVTAHTGGTATCMAQAVCSECGAAYGDVDSTKHTGVNHTENAKDATCKEAGYTGDTVCECGKTIQTGTATPLLTTHTWGEWAVVKEATEEAKGQEQRKCSVCEKTEEKDIPQLTHKHTPEKTDAKDATCGAAGNIEYWTCSGCGRFFREEACENELQENQLATTPTGKHTDQAGDGNHDCDVCPAKNVSAHTGGTATCMAQANCSECGTAYGDKNPQNHTRKNTTVINAKEPTCGAAGYTGDTVCECTVIIEQGTAIDATGKHTDQAGDGNHDCDNCPEKNVSQHAGGTATCMAQANCSECGAAYGDKNPDNHTRQNTTFANAKDPTCGEKGYQGDIICECGTKIGNGDEIAATGKHVYGAWTVTQGAASRKCTGCEATESIPLHNYRWKLNSAGSALTSVTENGNTQNKLTKTNGKIDGGVYTDYAASMAEPAVLRHDVPWAIEWKTEADWKGMILSSTGNIDIDAEYLFRNSDNGVLALGVRETISKKKVSSNYGGIGLTSDALGTNQSHVWRVENRVNADGSNMVYLVIDDIQIGAMNNHYKGSENQYATSEWVKGHDFAFGFIGAETTQYLNATNLEYLQIWEGTAEHKHAYVQTGGTEATCVHAADRSFRCYCGYTYTENSGVDKNNHTGNNHKVGEKPASCNEAGYSGDIVCECGTVIEKGSVLEQLEHKWSDWKIIQEATENKAGYMERECPLCKGKETRIIPQTGIKGKTVSILGDSISTYVGVSDSGAVNSTVEGSRLYYSYPGSNGGIYQEDTWWQQVIDTLGLELLVNNSWSGSRIFKERHNAAPAYIDRCVQLHNDHTGEEPDIILSFLGTNDMSYGADNLGTADVNEDEWGSYDAIDFSALIQRKTNGTFIYAEPQNVYESYAIMLHKMTQRYPSAEIYVMGLMARRDPVRLDKGNDVGQPTTRNAEIKKLAERYGCTYIDLESIISSDPADFDLCIYDQRVHPSKIGHDRMSQAVVSGILGQQVTLWEVTRNLSGVTSSNTDRFLLDGNAYETKLTAAAEFEEMKVTVTMGGKDITESSYSNGVVSIAKVTGDITITAVAHNPAVYRWEYNSTSKVLENVANDVYTANALTLKQGEITDGVLNEVNYKLAENVTLMHNKNWVIEWKSTGNWKGMLLSSSGNIDADSEYLYRNADTSLVAFGYRDSAKKSQNYGVLLPVNDFDLSQSHVWRLENRVNTDGTNMVYLIVDNVQIGAMNNHYIGSASQNATVDWLNGHDLNFRFIGASTSQLVSGMSLEYLQIWTDGTDHQHSYEATSVVEGTCNAKGSKTYACYCGDTYTEETEKNPDNHKFGEWAVVNGVMSRKCEYCSTVETAYATSYRWEMNQAGNALETKTTEGFVANALVAPGGSVSGGALSGYYAGVTTPVVLFHDQQWAIQWECTGLWNSMLLSESKDSTDGNWYVFSNTNNVIALGHYAESESTSKKAYKNYGVDLDNVISGFDWNAKHTWRLENRVATDGTNMVWLLVDGKSVCAMDNYFEGSTPVRASDNTLSGMDFVFRFIGTSNKPLNSKLTYLQVWPDDAEHTHKYIETSRTEGNCVNPGTIVSVCSCGDTRTETATSAPHSFGDWTVKDGVLSRACQNCTETETQVMSGYRWEVKPAENKMISVISNGSAMNRVTVTEGEIENGIIDSFAASLEKPVVLPYNSGWTIEFKTTTDWHGMLLLNKAVSTESGNVYLFRNAETGVFAIGNRVGNKYHNYGVNLADSGIDFDAEHVWRLENRVAADGSNMVYLLIDGTEMGAMNNYYVASVSQETTDNWVSGKNLIFNFIGSSGVQQLSDLGLKYLQIWTCAEPHLHQYKESGRTDSTCNAEGVITYTCAACSEFYTEPNGIIVPHNFGEWIEVDGVKLHKCTACGFEETEKKNIFRWEMNTVGNELLNITAGGSQSNKLTKTEGSVLNGKLLNYAASMEKTIILVHDKAWTIEWASSGDWKGMMLLSVPNDVNGAVYLYRNSENAMVVFGKNTDDAHHNYGVVMDDSNLDWSQKHVWRLENRVNADGSNMVYLVIDDIEIGAMNNYLKASEVDSTVDGNWLNGRDLTFGFMGAANGKELTDMNLDYLQINTDNEEHQHAYVLNDYESVGNCIEKGSYSGVCNCGATTSVPSEEFGPHSYGEWTTVGDVKQRVCKICQQPDTVTVGASYDVSVSKNYYNVISQKNYVLCDGAIESQIVLDNAEGSRRQVLNVVEVDTANTGVEILPGYYGIDKDLTNSENWSSRIVEVVMDYYRDELGYNVVAGMNTALTYTSNAPCSFMVYNGKVLATPNSIYNDNCDTYLAVIKNADGTVTCELRSINEPLTGNEWQAIAANFGFMVKDGKLVNKKVSRSGGGYHSMIGIKKDGSLVLAQQDGSNSGQTKGLNSYEMGETMIALGCEWAIKCDGGGSSQILTKREGESDHVLRNKPADGAARATINSIIIASKASSDGVFDHASIIPEYEYITPKGTVHITVKGVDAAGGPTELPEGITYKATGGTFKDGVFTSDSKTGDKKLTAYYNDEEVGSVTFKAVIPTHVAFENAEMAVPYGRSVDIRIKAYYNSYEVAVSDKDFKFALSTPLGTIDGLVFTANAEVEDNDNALLTATLIHNEAVVAKIPVFIGKGSEVIYDFEDQDLHGWYRSTNNEYNAVQPGGSTYIVSRNSGKVHSGDYAMAVELDYSNSLEGHFRSGTLVPGETKVFANPVTLGMWIYFSDEADSLLVNASARSFEKADGSGAIGNLNVTAGVTGAGETTSAETGFVYALDEPGWRYITIDLSSAEYAGFLADKTLLYFYICQKSGTNGYNYGYQSSVNGKYVFYVDDITVDYSRAVDDREPPVFAGMTYNAGGSAGEVNGNVVSTGSLSFAATVAEDQSKPNYTGLDRSTGCVYVDGVNRTDALSWSGDEMILNDVYLSNGMHTIKFGVSDNAGNYNSIVRSIIVGSADSASVKVVPHNPKANRLLLGSLYYIDVVADEADTISSVTVTMDLNNISNWELDHMDVADGFKASYSLIEDENIATVTITSTGATTLKGNDQILVSIPIRTWQLPVAEPIYGRDDVWMYDAYKAANEILPMDIKVTIDAGRVVYKSGASTTFTSPEIQVDTEMCGNAVTASGDAMYNYIGNEPWYASWNGGHDHRPETKKYYKAGSTNHVDAIALEDKPATCTENGYSGRTYCEVCKSVASWGTTKTKLGHSYSVTDGVLQCSMCKEAFNGVYTDGKTYVDGVVAKDGWYGETYVKNGKPLTGVKKVPSPENAKEKFYYDFGEDGICANRQKFTGLFADGSKYRYAFMGELETGWQIIDDDYYYFSPDTKAAVSGRYKVNGVVFEFEENGKLISGVWVNTLQGRRYYYGPSYHSYGWKEIDGEFYFFRNGYPVTGYQKVPVINLSNENKYYEFDENGVSKGIIDGIVMLNGKLRYLEDGVTVEKHLFKYKGDYYFSEYDGVLITDDYRYAYYTNCDLPTGRYHFGPDGKVIGGNANGEIVEFNGEKYYYEKGVPAEKGLVRVGNEYYFTVYGGELIKDQKYYAWMTDCDLPEGRYIFDAEGRMVGSAAEGEIVTIDGELRYYEKGKPQEKGLVKVGDDYYFTVYDGYLIQDQRYYAWMTNCDLPMKRYDFAADGKMCNGIVDKNGTLYYYENGNGVEKGLLKCEGDYYFSVYKGELIVDQDYYAWMTNCDLPEGKYSFGADGKMLQGVVNRDGKLYFYKNGNGLEQGLFKYDGHYYFSMYKGELVTGQKYYAYLTTCDLPEGRYEFAPDGKMYRGIVEKNGELYFYENGVGTEKGLFYFDGAYYHSEYKGKLTVSETVNAIKTSCELPVGSYTFGADGKALNGIIRKDNGLYYYKNGNAANGLFFYNGAYYCGEAGGKLVAGKVHTTDITNCDLPAGTYEFGADGKALNGIVDKSGVLYYYENGKRVEKNLFYLDGYYYFAQADGKLVTSQAFHVYEANGLLIEKTYTFNEKGQIVS